MKINKKMIKAVVVNSLHQVKAVQVPKVQVIKQIHRNLHKLLSLKNKKKI